MGLCSDGQKLNKEDIKLLIKTEASRQGIDPELAVAIAMVESSLNPKALGSKGEIGLFQILPKLFKEGPKASVEQQVKRGIEQLRYWKRVCPLQEGHTFIICYNSGYRKPRYPLLNPYYKRVVAVLNER